jgi:hypothetical protein
MFRGRLVATVDAATARKEDIGRMMATGVVDARSEGVA